MNTKLCWILLFALTIASVLSLQTYDDWDKRMYRGIGKRDPGARSFFDEKRLKMPLVYKRLKIFGAQNSMAESPSFGRRSFDDDEYFGDE